MTDRAATRTAWMSRPAARVALLLFGGGGLTVAGSLASCGGGEEPFCGDGTVDLGEQCDDGNANELDACRACLAYIAPRTVVKWEFNAAAAPGFTTDACGDVGARQVDVALAGPTPETRRVGCTDGRVTFVDLAPGEYTASVTPLDMAGTWLVTSPSTATFPANTTPGTTQEHTVVVPPEAWAQPMTGTFFFILRWAGMECGAAAPPVATQLVTLMRPGGPVSQQANVGSPYPIYRLDGTQPVPCVASVLAQAESAQGVPFGRATLTVSGRDSGGSEWFRGTFDTFVGAGASNPIYTFDIPSTVDAAIDAPIDAPVDAGVDAVEIDAIEIDAVEIDA